MPLQPYITLQEIWQNRGMVTSNGNPVQHGHLLKELLDVITLPRQLALCKCAAHQKDDSEITRGNNFVDNAAKNAAQQHLQALMTDEASHLIPLDVLEDEQKAAPLAEQKKWLKCGALLRDD